MPQAFRKLFPALLALLLSLLATLPSQAAERGPLRRPVPVADEDADGPRVIVKYRNLGTLMRAQSVAAPTAGPQHAAVLALRNGLALTDGRVIDRQMQVLFGAKGLSSAALAARLATDEDVEFAVPDRRRYALAAPNDPLYAASALISPAAGQWYLRAPDTTLVAAINAAAAWNITTGSSSIVVADLDTGVLLNHPDLAGKLVAGYDFIADITTAGDGDGRDADPTDPGDYTSAASSCGASTSSWHGTQTSSLIGAKTNNGVGMASVGYNVMVQPVRVLGRCGGYDSDIQAAMLWAGGVSAIPYANPTPARVINMSLGSDGACSSAYNNVISQLSAAGVVVVVAAGNDGLAIGTPANCSGVIAVTGLRHAGTKVGYSNLGPQATIGAPAGNCVDTSGATCVYPILTATNSGNTTATTNTYTNGTTNYAIGTSFATPLVAGTVGLMLSANPALTAAQVKSLLQSSARAFPTTSTDTTVGFCAAPTSAAQDSECICTTSTCGAGMLDAGAAVAAAAALAAPTASIGASATTVTVGSSVTLDGSASAAPGGRSITGYQWAITSGSAFAAFSSGTTAATATLATSASGSVTVQLTVTDSSGATASKSSTITVNPVAAPTVSLLASANTVTAGGSVTFDGSGSTAASGQVIAGYQWAITSGSGIAAFTSDTTSATATVATSGTGSGSFTVQLTVTDGGGRASSSSKTIAVTALAPTASISASSGAVTVGTAVSFDGSGSTATTGRNIASYQWTITSGGGLAAFSGSTSAATAQLATTGAGSVTVQLTVTDNTGATDSKTATVTISAPASSGGGGGGASSVLWLALLSLASFSLRRVGSARTRR